MRVAYFNNPTAFNDAVLPFLRQREAENNIPLGILGPLAARLGTSLPEQDTPLLCAVENDDEVVGVALQTPPHALNVTRMPQEALEALADALATIRPNLFGAVGPREVVAAFYECWSRRTGATITRNKDLWLYELGTLRAASVAGGYAAFATEEDFELCVQWRSDFSNELGLPLGNPESDTRDRIAQRNLLLWKADETVAMAGARAITPTAARIGPVYTPPDARRKGYASGVVHALSKHLLDTGRTSCFLFTDADNTGANDVYIKLGYRKIGEFAEYWFA